MRRIDRVNRARQAWKDLPTYQSAWGLSMKAKIAAYFDVHESEMDY